MCDIMERISKAAEKEYPLQQSADRHTAYLQGASAVLDMLSKEPLDVVITMIADYLTEKQKFQKHG